MSNAKAVISGSLLKSTFEKAFGCLVSKMLHDTADRILCGDTRLIVVGNIFHTIHRTALSDLILIG